MSLAVTRVRVLGRSLHVLRGGEGPPLLYLHSSVGEALPLPHLVALSGGRELHVPAHPGFLDSEGLEEIRDVEDYAYHYEAYLDAMGWDSVDVVGLSLGGWIAAELAARHPARVKRLVLTSAVGIWIRSRPIADIFALDTRHPERIAELFFHDPGHPIAQLVRGPARGEQVSDEILTAFLRAMAATARVGWNPLLHDPRLEGLLHRVKAPTLCLWGASDRVVPPVYGERYAERIPDAKLQIVPECGHLVPFEKPEAFVAAVSGFLR